MKRTLKLGVNIDHVATLRRAPGNFRVRNMRRRYANRLERTAYRASPGGPPHIQDAEMRTWSARSNV